MKIDNTRQLGALRLLLSPFVESQSVKDEMHRLPTMAFVGLGQGGGRMAAEFSRFGYPTYLFNSSKSDLNEHKGLIPDARRIETKSIKFAGLEGTDKNAQLGYEIAVENKELYKRVAVEQEIQEADFVWINVSLGGGSGNGALKVAMQYLSQIRSRRALPGGKVPFGIICSLPSKDERGSAFRRNALAGINLIQQFMQEGKMGAALVIDNEKLKDYYEQTPLVTKVGMGIDARSYTNMVVASTLFETSALPLLEGRSVFDKTELLSAWSTPGWMSISRKIIANGFETIDYYGELNDLFKKNEVLANNSIENVLTGAVAVLFPNNRLISPQVADEIYSIASEILNTRVNHAIAKNDNMKDQLLLFGLAVVPNPPSRIKELESELNEWIEIEKRQKQALKENSSELSGFDDFFTTNGNQIRNSGLATLSDLDDGGSNKNPAPLASYSDLDDDF
ncbi:cell division protein FtsZ [Paenibacillus sp. Leaf72]|uniref:cell division protein FtsZ n=1 Tax=Paenibacillus sp. Leaf72 TaxID=1736234 RepID=UPI000700E8CA|nr:cell division protein FtsZ [Paenibacillus sp. Leaf72]KQN96769.1 cell division protein FtsZ [Paenibacillus sp. Leaf72]